SFLDVHFGVVSLLAGLLLRQPFLDARVAVRAAFLGRSLLDAHLDFIVGFLGAHLLLRLALLDADFRFLIIVLLLILPLLLDLLIVVSRRFAGLALVLAGLAARRVDHLGPERCQAARAEYHLSELAWLDDDRMACRTDDTHAHDSSSMTPDYPMIASAFSAS